MVAPQVLTASISKLHMCILRGFPLIPLSVTSQKARAGSESIMALDLALSGYTCKKLAKASAELVTQQCLQ